MGVYDVKVLLQEMERKRGCERSIPDPSDRYQGKNLKILVNSGMRPALCADYCYLMSPFDELSGEIPHISFDSS
jgi:hypothetical protein